MTTSRAGGSGPSPRASTADLPVVVDRSAAAPLAAQIAGQLRDAVTSGVLRAGERVPSTRDLAAALGVSRTVVTNAYTQLFAEGWLEGRHGSGSYVADVTPLPEPPHNSKMRVSAVSGMLAEPSAAEPGESGAGRVPAGGRRPSRAHDAIPSPRTGRTVAPAPAQRAPASEHLGADLGRGPSKRSRAGSRGTPEPAGSLMPVTASNRRMVAGGSKGGGAPLGNTKLIELTTGVPWAEGIEAAAWRRAWRAAGTRPPSAWPDAFGVPELRAELAGYLRRSRGLAVMPDEVLVTRGVTSGLTILAAALIRPGDRVGLEEPGYPRARDVLARAGAEVLPCRVDAHGIVPEDLPDGLRLVYTTPAHQYPLGGRLPVGRRQALAAWARSAGALIVEDDYDSEFRYDVGPLPVLRSMDPDVIVYLGTASKTLTPALGVGWLVAPAGLVEVLAGMRTEISERVTEAAQYALAEMIASGDAERHIRRMCLEYARRRAALVEQLGGNPGGGRLIGDTAGLHAVLQLPPGRPAGPAAAEAMRRGVAVATLDRYFAGQTTVQGLILGYGATPLPEVRRAARILRAALSA